MLWTPLLTLTWLSATSALYRLDFRPMDFIDIPPNIQQDATCTTYDGTATVALASRTLYRCVSYASLISTYNSMDEHMIPMPPSRPELEEWTKRKQVAIGSEVNGGVGSEFDPCISGNELKDARFVDSSEITRNCYPSNMFRSACFMSWSANFKLASLPIFMDSNGTAYIVSPSGAKLPAVVGSYHSQENHALLITALPRKSVSQVKINCFINHTEIACLDPATSQFSRIDFPVNNYPPATPESYTHCRFHFCWTFPAAFFRSMQEERDNIRKAHESATGERSLRRRRRSAQSAPDPNTDFELITQRPTFWLFSRPTEPLPTTAASVADFENLQDQLHTLYQAQQFNTAILSVQISELQKAQYHTALSVAKQDDLYLSHLWQQSFSTHFLNYDTFTINPTPVHHTPSSNCRKSGKEIFLSGRYVKKGRQDRCHIWSPSEVSSIPMFHHHQLVVPTASTIKHTATDQEFSWSYLLNKRSGLEEGATLRHFGGVRSTGLVDILGYAPSIIPTLFHSLFSLSSFGVVSFLMMFLFCCIYVRR